MADGVAKTKTISRHPDFKIHVEWDSESPEVSKYVDEATCGRVAISVGGELIWGQYGPSDEVVGIHWEWIELAEHLAQEWPWLELEEDWPFNLPAASPCELPTLFDQYVRRARPHADEAKERFHQWRSSHDLSRSVQGAWGIPTLWLLRAGNCMWVASETHAFLLPCQAVLDTLADLVEEILARVKVVQRGSDRGAELLKDWRKRRKIPVDQKIAIATGLERRALGKIAGKSSVPSFFDAPRRFGVTEKMVTARMAHDAVAARMAPGESSIGVLRRILQRLAAIPATTPSQALEAASEDARGALGGGHAEPYREGQIVAKALRKHLKLAPDSRVDPDRILRSRFEVLVQYRDLGKNSEVIDGFACWGPAHGPAVIVNTRGIHSHSERGRRATLAHEIAHLLLDRDATLPLAEVKGHLPTTRPEQRASAFAAELLIPQEVAGLAFAESRDPKATIHSLAGRFGASYAVIAWQALNSGMSLSRKTERFLWTKAPAPRYSPTNSWASA